MDRGDGTTSASSRDPTRDNRHQLQTATAFCRLSTQLYWVVVHTTRIFSCVPVYTKLQHTWSQIVVVPVQDWFKWFFFFFGNQS
jgi:hypothetical protein